LTRVDAVAQRAQSSFAL
jgi:hypothetical protein